MASSLIRIFALVTLTMIAFAANSVLARLALADGAIDPASYTLLRLASGALMLVVLAFMTSKQNTGDVVRSGHWISAAALFVYAAGFSVAYLALDTGVGALILFAVVQATMIGWALYSGDRPIALEWVGLITAFGAFVWLVSPGLSAPDPYGTVLMVAAGVAWGVYSVRGRSSVDPLAATAGNFVMAVPLGIAMLAVWAFYLSASWQGIALGVASGAITSGLGYALWYRVLPLITGTQAAIVQLTVPVIAAAGGVLFASDPLTMRFIVASALILGGVALAITAKARRASP
ncbi:MAG: DMT family transporter [Pseudomonadota bacterium]